MENYTQLKELNVLIGKTITKVARPITVDGYAIVVLFFDKDYVVFEAGTGYDGTGHSGELLLVKVSNDDLSSYDKRVIGIISEEEYEIIKKKEGEKRLEYNKQNELCQLELLIKKYGVPGECH